MATKGSSAAERSLAGHDECRPMIKKAYPNIIKSLTTPEVATINSQLYSDGIFLTRERESIQACTTATESAQTLCDFILKKGEYVSQMFVKALQEISRGNLVDCNVTDWRDANTPDIERLLAQLVKKLEDCQYSAKRQRLELKNVQEQHLQSQEEKLQHQQAKQNETKKNLENLKNELEEKDLLRMTQDIAVKQQLQTEREEIRKQQRQVFEQEKKLREEATNIERRRIKLMRQLQTEREELKKQLMLDLENLEEKKKMFQENEKTFSTRQIEEMQQLKTEKMEFHKQKKQDLENLEKRKNEQDEKERIWQINHSEQVLQLHAEKEEFRLQREHALEDLMKQKNELQKKVAAWDELQRNVAAWEFIAEIKSREPVHHELPVKCKDVAVTTDGRLLLAAKKLGMLEYDDRGTQLSSWIPAKTVKGRKERVVTVDELPDGRMAVGLLPKNIVVLLGRSGSRLDSWQQEPDIQLQGPPRQLSVSSQLMAVVEDKQLVLLSLIDGHTLLRHHTDYGISSVAATADAVITASLGQVKLSDGRKQHVVDSYSHSGQLLWRQSFNEQVYDLHWSQVHSVVYLALRDSDKLTAIRAVDGQQLVEVLNSSHGLKKPLKKPWRLSLSRGPRTVMAVLEKDKNRVTVYLPMTLVGRM